jgi:hypothetical protein
MRSIARLVAAEFRIGQDLVCGEVVVSDVFASNEEDENM